MWCNATSCLQRAYAQTARQLKRFDSIKRSPVFNLFSETLNGVTSIRAYGCQERFIRQNDHDLDESQRIWYMVFTANRLVQAYYMWVLNVPELIFFFSFYKHGAHSIDWICNYIIVGFEHALGVLWTILKPCSTVSDTTRAARRVWWQVEQGFKIVYKTTRNVQTPFWYDKTWVKFKQNFELFYGAYVFSANFPTAQKVNNQNCTVENLMSQPFYLYLWSCICILMI